MDNTMTLDAGPYQALPDMPPEQFEALKADIAERGVLTPIDVDEGGTILDGHHRYRACCELNITEFPTIVRLGLDEAHKRAFARKSNALRRHLTRAQLRHLIADQLRDTPQWANNRIGRELGVDSKTVATVRARLESTSEIPKFDRLIGADGKERPTKQTRPPAVMTPDLDELARVLARIKEGLPPEQEVSEGFMSGTVFLGTIDSFTEHTEEQIRQFHLFACFLARMVGCELEGAQAHVEWAARKGFTDPDDFLTSKNRCGLPPVPPKTIAAWRKFAEEYQDTTAEGIDRLIEEIRKEQAAILAKREKRAAAAREQRKRRRKARAASSHASA